MREMFSFVVMIGLSSETLILTVIPSVKLANDVTYKR